MYEERWKSVGGDPLGLGLNTLVPSYVDLEYTQKVFVSLTSPHQRRTRSYCGFTREDIKAPYVKVVQEMAKHSAETLLDMFSAWTNRVLGELERIPLRPDQRGHSVILPAFVHAGHHEETNRENDRAKFTVSHP